TDNQDGTYTATFTATAVGSARTITATLNGVAVTTTLPTITVTPASLTVTADDKSMTYSGTVPSLTYKYTGLVNADTTASFTGAVATTATSSSVVGSYDITQGDLAATDNYTIGTFTKGTLKVNPAALTAAGVNFSATAGAPFSGKVATFTTP